MLKPVEDMTAFEYQEWQREQAKTCICPGGPRADVKDPDCRVHGRHTRAS